MTETVQINKTSVQSLGTKGKGVNPPSTQGTAPPADTVQIADAPRAIPDCGCAAQPVFSIGSGDAATGFEVSIASASKDAA
ncbi:MAG: hypothetical protein KGL13_04920, partial [Gammaproteobacteria bacterium]|nr:hypothetical protein [Gammaproteobacteria bacterium]